MSGQHPVPQSGVGSESFSMFYLAIGGAALLSTVLFPVTFILALRYYRQLSSSAAGELPGGTLGDIFAGGKPQQEQPKLFDVYVKPGLEVKQTRFEDILPMAVHTADTGLSEKGLAAPVASAASSSPGSPRTHWSPHSRGREVDKPKAPAQEDVSATYDVAVLIVMPTSHRVVDHWDEMGEYDIGTLKLNVTTSPDDSMHSISIS